MDPDLEQGSNIRAFLPEEPLELPVPEFVQIEANLASLGFFTPSNKRIRDVKKKTVKITKMVEGQKEEKRVTIIPTAVHGLPITSDQDKYVALMKIIQDTKASKGIIINPVTFTTAQLLQLLDQTDAGKNYGAVHEWLQRMTGTLIISERAIYFAGKKEWRSANFHVFEASVSKGQELEDGTVAEKHHIFLSEWQLQNLNQNHSLPLDWETYKRLKSHISKALIFPLQILLYATRRQGRFEKSYDDLCRFLHLRPYAYASKIREKLGPALDELQRHGYLKKWEIEKRKDDKGFKIVFRHGEKFYRDRRLRGERRKDKIESKNVSAPVAISAAIESDDSDLVARLAVWGVPKDTARGLLQNLGPDQPVVDQIEYAEEEIKKSDGRIQNPAGFLIALIRDNRALPATFVSTRDRQLLEENRRALEEAHQKRLAAYEEYKRTAVERFIAEKLGQEYPTRLQAKLERLRRIMRKSDEELMPFAESSLRDEIAREMPDLQTEEEFLDRQGGT